jgi:divalent metal cation (Fe/Co/Zn/Cd) transporter
VSEQVIKLGGANRKRLIKRGLYLEYFTVAYNSLEGLIALVAGLIAGSIALVGFGFDSIIEVSSGATLLWRLHTDVNEDRREQIEKTALKIVGFCFIALALYIGFDSIRSLWQREPPGESIPGIVLAAASLVVMPLLATAKKRVARKIRSGALAADAKQTELCTWLSAILLGGLLLNALFGWWWADPIAGLVMLPIIAREGIEALKGKSCCLDDQCHG